MYIYIYIYVHIYIHIYVDINIYWQTHTYILYIHTCILTHTGWRRGGRGCARKPSRQMIRLPRASPSTKSEVRELGACFAARCYVLQCVVRWCKGLPSTKSEVQHGLHCNIVSHKILSHKHCITQDSVMHCNTRQHINTQPHAQTRALGKTRESLFAKHASDSWLINQGTSRS